MQLGFVWYHVLFEHLPLQETSAILNRVRMGENALGTVGGWMDIDANARLISQEGTVKVQAEW